MKYFYDALLNLFYCDMNKEAYVAAGKWPENLVAVSQETFTEFAGTPPNGKMRIAGEDGLPAWANLPPPTREEILQGMEITRQQLLTYADETMADWRTELMLDDISDEDRAKLSAWMAYKKQIKAITADDAIADGFEWPAMPAV